MKKRKLKHVIMLLIVGVLIISGYYILSEKESFIGNYVVVLKQSEKLKSEPIQTSKTKANLKIGTPVLLISKVEYLRRNYYKVAYYQGKYKVTGYIREKYGKLYHFDPNFENKIQSFPNSYKQYLRYIHLLYPNWQFSKLAIAKDFSDSAKKYQVKALIDSNDSALISNQLVKEGTNWRQANLQTVKYYLDPRNGLYLVNSLMFETLSYHSQETIEVAKNMLKGTYMTGIESTSHKPWAYLFYQAARKYNVSMANLIARVIIEQGATSSNNGGLGNQGKVIDGKRYYNLFNIKANSGALDGIYYAKKHNWDTREKAINEAAKYIASKYFSYKQNSLYLQRFDLYSKELGTHSYMTNISACFSEASTLLSMYYTSGYLNQIHYLSIPVFKNMPSYSPYPIENDINNHSLYSSYYLKDINNMKIMIDKKNVKVIDGNQELRENIDYVLVNNYVYGLNQYTGKVKIK